MLRVLLVLAFLMVVINQCIIAADKTPFTGGEVTDKQIIALVNRANINSARKAPKIFNINFAPQKDSDFSKNQHYCRYENTSMKTIKAQSIGKLICLPGGLGNYKYAIPKGNNTFYAIYGSGLLHSIVVEPQGSPVKRYLYQVKYPVATLQKIKYIQSPDAKLVLNAQGKLDKLLYKKQCYTLNSQGKIVELHYASALCGDVIETGFYDGYQAQAKPY